MKVITRRRDTRRRKRDERKQRSPEEIETARAQRETELASDDTPETPLIDEGVSWTGLAGGLLGMLPMTFFGVTALADPNVSDAAGLFVLIGVGFVPAIWVSIRPTKVRQRVLKSTVVACLGLVFFGAILARDAVLPIIMMPATALLAVASGLIFQRSPKSG